MPLHRYNTLPLTTQTHSPTYLPSRAQTTHHSLPTAASSFPYSQGQGEKRSLDQVEDDTDVDTLQDDDDEYDEFASDPEVDYEPDEVTNATSQHHQDSDQQDDDDFFDQLWEYEEQENTDDEGLIDDSPYLDQAGDQPQTASRYPYSAREDEYDDDAAEFEKLMRLTEAMRAGKEITTEIEFSAQEAGREGGIDQPEGSTRHQSSDSSSSIRRLGANADEEIRTQAISFLESFPISLLTQLRDSLLIIDTREKERKITGNKKRKKSIKQNKQKSQDNDDVEDEGNVRDEVASSEERSQEKMKAKKRNEHMGIQFALRNRKTGNDQIISYPDDPTSNSKKESSMHKITLIMRVTSILYEAVLERTVITLRDIFYRDKALFKRQDIVDKLVDDLVATARLKRKDFYVCASAKGLIASSSLKIYRRSGEEVTLSPTSPTLIDPVERIDRVEAPDGLSWVLLVEKDAVFQSLCSAKMLKDGRFGPGAMITGKGFPDLATKQFLHLLVETFPNVKLYALVDADPHGLSILSTYTYGSKATAHSFDHAGLALGDRLEWLGVKTTDWKKLGIKHDDLLPLEKPDIQLATSMLKNHANLPPKWKRELCHMLHLNRKAEIEIVLGANNGIEISGPNDILDDLYMKDTIRVGESQGQSQSQSQSQAKRKKTGVNKLVEYVFERMS
nr:uncharacterized protein CI109_006555 [Kwoniella shandongensis]KAA5525093.1 hypothetical protein CI109_006555 [Kwoniella shandongensis]